MRVPAAVIFGVLAIALTPDAAVSGPFEDGLKAAESGDFATALRLWQPLAEQGHADAQSNLGFMYQTGLGVPQDDAEALKWYQLAAEQGHARAQFYLGGMYGAGRGVPQDFVRAHMWFSLAASHSFSGRVHDKAVQDRDAVAERMTPAQIAEAQKLARQWWKRRKQYE